jgi:hypothetical protein
MSSEVLGRVDKRFRYQFESGSSGGINFGLSVDKLEDPHCGVDRSVVVWCKSCGLANHRGAQNEGFAHSETEWLIMHKITNEENG